MQVGSFHSFWKYMNAEFRRCNINISFFFWFLSGRPSCINWTSSTIPSNTSSCREMVTSHADCTRHYPRNWCWLKNQNDEFFQAWVTNIQYFQFIVSGNVCCFSFIKVLMIVHIFCFSDTLHSFLWLEMSWKITIINLDARMRLANQLQSNNNINRGVSSFIEPSK